MDVLQIVLCVCSMVLFISAFVTSCEKNKAERKIRISFFIFVLFLITIIF